MGKCYFDVDWLSNELYKDWLACDPKGDKSSFMCRASNKTCLIRSSGIKALESHRKSSKHQKNCLAKRRNSSILFELCKPTNSNDNQPSSSGSEKAAAAVVSDDDDTIIRSSEVVKQQGRSSTAGISKFVSDIDTLKAEIRWTLHVISTHNSARSSDGVDKLFSVMFPDSRIAATFKCARTKLGYLSTFGIAPAIVEELWKAVSAASHVVIMFDESLNSDLQKKQMDIHLKFMDVDGTVKCKYFTSYFLGKSRACDIFEKLSDVLSRIGAQKLIQLSMDGPNVNWSVFKELTQEVQSKSPSHHSLLNIGSCGIHTTHNSFKSGATDSTWGLVDLLKFSYFLFNESPARREEFFKITGSTKLPLPFCGHRWLENTPAAQRLIEIWPSICLYLKAVNEKKVSVPTCKSYVEVASFSNDKLLIAKLHSFVFVANILKPFLTYFQKDEPLSPFIYTSLFEICLRLYGLITTSDFCDSLKSKGEIVLPKHVGVDSFLSERKVNVGFQASSIIKQFESDKKQQSVSPFQLKHFRQCFVKLVKGVLYKLIQKSPLKYPLSKFLTCIDPVVMQNPEKAKHLFSSLTESFSDSKLITPDSVDGLRADYENFIDTINCSFNRHTDRLDHFYRDSTCLSQYPALQSLFYIVLTLSHGNSDVERGFSVNREVTVENMYEETLVARRLICQYVTDNDPATVPLSKNMIFSCRKSYSSYNAALEKKREEKQEEEKSGSRRRKNEELAGLMSKKRKLELDIDTLRRDSDRMAERAEDAPAKFKHELIVMLSEGPLQKNKAN